MAISSVWFLMGRVDGLYPEMAEPLQAAPPTWIAENSYFFGFACGAFTRIECFTVQYAVHPDDIPPADMYETLDEEIEPYAEYDGPGQWVPDPSEHPIHRA